MSLNRLLQVVYYCHKLWQVALGLNIQSASVVIICEPQIKPSIESRAISRAYRMGTIKKCIGLSLVM